MQSFEYLQSSYDVLNSRKPFQCNVLWSFIGSRNFAVRIKRTDLRSDSARGRQISRNVLRRENQEKMKKKKLLNTFRLMWINSGNCM